MAKQRKYRQVVAVAQTLTYYHSSAVCSQRRLSLFFSLGLIRDQLQHKQFFASCTWDCLMNTCFFLPTLLSVSCAGISGMQSCNLYKQGSRWAKAEFFLFPFFHLLWQVTADIQGYIISCYHHNCFQLIQHLLVHSVQWESKALVFLFLSTRHEDITPAHISGTTAFFEGTSKDLLHFLVKSVDCLTELLISRWKFCLCKHGYKFPPGQCSRGATLHISDLQEVWNCKPGKSSEAKGFHPAVKLLCTCSFKSMSTASVPLHMHVLGGLLKDSVFSYKGDMFSGFWHRCVQILWGGLKNTAV